MKNKIKQLSHEPIFKLALASIVWIMILVPLLGALHIVGRTFRISIIFLIINIIFSVLIGHFVKLKQFKLYLITIFPIIFVLQVIIRYGKYGYFFGAIYLLVSLLSYILTNKE